MKRFLLLIICLPFLSECNLKENARIENDMDSCHFDSIAEQPNNSIDTNSLSTEIQKTQPNNSAIATQTVAKVFRVSGIVYVSQKYCSGARPPESVRIEAEKYKPTAGVLLAFRKGTSNSQSDIVASCLSDENGYYSVSLSKGIYCMIVNEQVKSRTFIQNGGNDRESSPGCFSVWWDKCQRQIEVSNYDLVNIDIYLNRNCRTPSFCPCVFNTSSQQIP